jgi:hypothetical protein
MASHPIRRLFGCLAAAVATADLAVATALPGNALGIPTVRAESRPLMVAYGIGLLLVALAAIATSFRHETEVDEAEEDAAPARRPVAEGDESSVIHALRENGWYVADDVLLPHIAVDHVAVGPAGVLAVQVMWTDRQEAPGGASARARIGAAELRKLLATKELAVDVVPAVLAFGPGLTEEPGGVKVVDSVAILFGDQSDLWIRELSRRRLLHEHPVDAVRSIIADIREGIAPQATPVLVPAS